MYELAPVYSPSSVCVFSYADGPFFEPCIFADFLGHTPYLQIFGNIIIRQRLKFGNKNYESMRYEGYMSVEFESFAYYERVLHNDPEAAAKISIEQVKTLFPHFK